MSGEFMAEEQKARMQAIKDSEFRAANDDGEPATDLAGVGPSSLSPPDVVHVTVEDEEFGEDFTVKVSIPDLIAAIRQAVESGTIKGAVVDSRHRFIVFDETTGSNVAFEPDTYLVIPISKLEPYRQIGNWTRTTNG